MLIEVIKNKMEFYCFADIYLYKMEMNLWLFFNLNFLLALYVIKSEIPNKKNGNLFNIN